MNGELCLRTKVFVFSFRLDEDRAEKSPLLEQDAVEKTVPDARAPRKAEGVGADGIDGVLEQLQNYEENF